ncbi:MAG: cellulase family glycosylhydrolase [Hyphomicrobiales bacterium]
MAERARGAMAGAMLLAALTLSTPALCRDFLLGVHTGFDAGALTVAGDDFATMRAHVDRAAALGARLLRVPADWRQLQPRRGAPQGTFDRHQLSLLLETVRHAAGRGLRVVVMLAQSPCWAVPAGLDCETPEAIWHPPLDPKAYAAAFAYLAGELKDAGLAPVVVGWEVWNEPNSITFWPAGHIRAGYNVLVGPSDADGYVALLNAANDALKAVDPGFTVLGGSLASADTAYLERMYDLGARYDGLAIHPYAKADPARDGLAYGPDACGAGTDPLAPPWCFRAGVEALRAVMRRHGDDRPVWFTEFGWSSHAGWGGSGSEEAQAANLKGALDLIAGWDFVPAAIVYRLVDDAEGMGLLRDDLGEKPAGTVFSRWRSVEETAVEGGPGAGTPVDLKGSVAD